MSTMRGTPSVLGLAALLALVACAADEGDGGEPPPLPAGRHEAARLDRTPEKDVRATDHGPDPSTWPLLQTLDVGHATGARPSAADFERDRRPVRPAADVVSSCSYYELRGWLQIVCSTDHDSVFLLGGSADGVALDASEGVVIVLPLARGDTRVFQIATAAEGYEGPVGLVQSFVLSESWVGTTGPHVAATYPFGGMHF